MLEHTEVVGKIAGCVSQLIGVFAEPVGTQIV